MIALLWAKIWKYVVAAGAIAVAIGSVWLKGRAGGKATQKAKDDARDAQANATAAKQVNQTQESRHETDAEVSKLPAAPVQTVATADPATAAGHLRDDGWVLPEDGGPH